MAAGATQIPKMTYDPSRPEIEQGSRMTRTPAPESESVRDIRSTAALARQLVEPARTALRHLADHTPSPYGSGGSGGSGGIGNPTLTRTLAGLPYRAAHSRITRLAAVLLVAAQELDEAIRDVGVHAADGAEHEQLVRNLRCSGGWDHWQRPDCTNLGVTVDERTKQPLCDACRQRRDYHERQRAAS